MARMKEWKVTYERYNPQLGVHEHTHYKPILAATAQSAVNKLNKQFEEAERRGAYGHNIAIIAEPWA